MNPYSSVDSINRCAQHYIIIAFIVQELEKTKLHEWCFLLINLVTLFTPHHVKQRRVHLGADVSHTDWDREVPNTSRGPAWCLIMIGQLQPITGHD